MKIEQSQNILNWYNFNDKQDVLEVGLNNEKITELLNQKCKSVITIKANKDSLNEIKDKKFDIITLIGIEESLKKDSEESIKLIELLNLLNFKLKENGKILLAVDNKFGIRFFAGNPEKILNKKFESLIGYNNEFSKIETFTKKYLENLLIKNGYKFYFYYPLPDYKIPNVIFTDRQLPNYTSIDKYNPYFTEKSDILINEIDVFREILKTDENMFTFFANSFLIEISKSDVNKKYKYISFNNIRKEEYQLITKITDEYVEKDIVSEKATIHYNNIKYNLKILESNNIKTVDYIENEIIKSRYVNQDYMLNNVLARFLEQGDKESFFEILDRYILLISKNAYIENDYEKTAFAKYGIEVDSDIIKKMHFVKNCLWDMTFKNCFYVNDEFLFFDQEWNEENLPYEYILYRSIFYTISLRRFLNIEELFKKYNLECYIDVFKKLDDKLQKKIRNNEVWNFYSQNCYFDIDATKQEIINLNKRSEAQIGAIKNLKKENELLTNENQEINRKNQELIEENIRLINQKFSTKIKRLFKTKN